MVILSIINNDYFSQHWLIYLTTFYKNLFFLFFLFFWKKKFFLSIVFMLILNAKQQINLFALSNTLFLIHPVLLYWTFQKSLFNATTSIQSNFLMIAMILGGFWSMQELNWGGWWNWDVLESNVLILFLIIVCWNHVIPLKTKIKKINFKNLLIIAIVVSYGLNKTGFGLSIHNFVTTNFLKKNYIFFFITIFLIVVFGLPLFSKIIFMAIVVIFLNYCFFIDLKFFKKFIFLIFFFKKKNFLWNLKIMHLVFIIGFYFFFIFNAHNKIFLLKQNNCVLLKQQNTIYIKSTQGSKINLFYIYNNKNLFLCKPKNQISGFLHTINLKKTHIKAINYTYLK